MTRLSLAFSLGAIVLSGAPATGEARPQAAAGEQAKRPRVSIRMPLAEGTWESPNGTLRTSRRVGDIYVIDTYAGGEVGKPYTASKHRSVRDAATGKLVRWRRADLSLKRGVWFITSSERPSTRGPEVEIEFGAMDGHPFVPVAIALDHARARKQVVLTNILGVDLRIAPGDSFAIAVGGLSSALPDAVEDFFAQPVEGLVHPRMSARTKREIIAYHEAKPRNLAPADRER